MPGTHWHRLGLARLHELSHALGSVHGDERGGVGSIAQHRCGCLSREGVSQPGGSLVPRLEPGPNAGGWAPRATAWQQAAARLLAHAGRQRNRKPLGRYC